MYFLTHPLYNILFGIEVLIFLFNCLHTLENFIDFLLSKLLVGVTVGIFLLMENDKLLFSKGELHIFLALRRRHRAEREGKEKFVKQSRWVRLPHIYFIFKKGVPAGSIRMICPDPFIFNHDQRLDWVSNLPE